MKVKKGQLVAIMNDWESEYGDIFHYIMGIYKTSCDFDTRKIYKKSKKCNEDTIIKWLLDSGYIKNKKDFVELDINSYLI